MTTSTGMTTATEMPLADLARELSISYRQAEHWAARGYIRCAPAGKGHKRYVRGLEVQVLRNLAALVRAGFRWETAAEYARALAEQGAKGAMLPGGVRVHLARGGEQ